MRALGKIVPVVGVMAFIAGCDRSDLVQPGARQASAVASHDAHAGGKPEIDPTYANGQTVYMIGPRMIENARETQPNLYDHAPELYLLVYPQNFLPTPDSPGITLLSGYQPQCNPCFHPGLPAPFTFHDHVITAAPGTGKNGTADEFKAPWKLILLVYNPDYVSSPTFTPIKSEADIDAAEEAGNVFLPINTGPGKPYEIDTGNLLICPIVSNKA